MYERTFVNIDMAALRHNMRAVKRGAGNAEVMPVVKANAYGHGAVNCAVVLEDMAAMFLVAIVEEGVELRNAGIKKPILISGFTPLVFLDHIFDYNLIPSICNMVTAFALNEAARKKNKALEVHINIDTGIGRTGFLPNELSLIKEVLDLPYLKVTGIYTHYACADEDDKSFTYFQQRIFEGLLKELPHKQLLVHASNSAGVMQRHKQYNMVRPGIMLYGLCPSGDKSKFISEKTVVTPKNTKKNQKKYAENKKNLDLIPILSWFAHISHVKYLPKGSGISYNHIYKTKKRTKVATIPVGYADGYPRALSNKGYVLINGQYAPVIGRVCMDQFMVDATHIADLQVGTRAVLVGSDQDKQITIDELASLAGTCNYEFVCGISFRVPRNLLNKTVT